MKRTPRHHTALQQQYVSCTNQLLGGCVVFLLLPIRSLLKYLLVSVLYGDVMGDEEDQKRALPSHVRTVLLLWYDR